MSWLNSIFISLLSGALGLICGGLVMAACVSWHNVSSFEGKSGFAIIGIALLGGIAGLIIGLVVAREVAAGDAPTFLKGLGTAAGLVVAISVVAAGLGWLTGDHTPNMDIQDSSPPPPTQAEQAAAKAAQEQADFDAIPDDAPLTAWLSYVKYAASDERWAEVTQRITAKPGWIAELSDVMITEDVRIAEAALALVPHLPEPPQELVTSVKAAGRHLAEQIQEVNATTEEQDPSYYRAADVSIRFGGWMKAVRALHAKPGGDFIPELREILELSRVRTDSYVMKHNVQRVASYYVKEWAGIEPLPDDPPPK
jgi:hypothetical protein